MVHRGDHRRGSAYVHRAALLPPSWPELRCRGVCRWAGRALADESVAGRDHPALRHVGVDAPARAGPGWWAGDSSSSFAVTKHPSSKGDTNAADAAGAADGPEGIEPSSTETKRKVLGGARGEASTPGAIGVIRSFSSIRVTF